MRCFIDANVLISAGLFPESTPAKALEKALAPPNEAIVSDYALDEVHRVTSIKFPHKMRDLEAFLYRTMFSARLVITPAEDAEDEEKVSDAGDRPILRGALAAGADVLITGDKGLLVTDVSTPRIINPAEFLNM